MFKIDPEILKQYAKEHLQELGLHSSTNISVSTLAEIPRTVNGKTKRSVLRQKVMEVDRCRPQKINTIGLQLPEDQSELAKAFSKVFPDKEITSESSFVLLGGDSPQPY